MHASAKLLSCGNAVCPTKAPTTHMCFQSPELTAVILCCLPESTYVLSLMLDTLAFSKCSSMAAGQAHTHGHVQKVHAFPSPLEKPYVQC